MVCELVSQLLIISKCRAREQICPDGSVTGHQGAAERREERGQTVRKKIQIWAKQKSKEKRRKRSGIEVRTARGASRRDGTSAAGRGPPGAHIQGPSKGGLGILSRK